MSVLMPTFTSFIHSIRVRLFSHRKFVSPSLRMQATAAREMWKETKGLKGPGIPAPPGQFRVGCVDLVHHLQGDERGGLLLRLHYPTEARPEDNYSYANWYPHTPKVPALEGAPLISEASLLAESDLLATPTLPVVVFSHGLCGMRTTYSAIACDLASYGYLVACVEHRDGSASVVLQRVPTPGGEEGEFQDHWIPYEHVEESEKERNRQVKIRVDDAKKTLDILHLLNEGKEVRNMMGGTFSFKQFLGRMELDMAAIMGHSFGGATALLTLAEDRRFKCGIAMDCWMVPVLEDFCKDPSTNVPSPLYFISSYHFQWKENVQRIMSLTKPPGSDGKTSCRVLTLRGTHHFNQCDIPFVAEDSLCNLGPEKSELDSTTAHNLNIDIYCAFLRRYLLRDPVYQETVPNLDGTEGHSENIIFGTNLDLSRLY